MNRFALLLICIFALLISACIPASASPTATAVPATASPTFTAVPTFTEVPLPTPTPPFLDLDNGKKAVVYDFTERLCEANWMNGGEKHLPCPGDLNDPLHGYVGLLSGSDLGLPDDLAMVVMYPAQPSSGYGAIFGRFPKFKAGPFDVFRASLACRSGANCDVEFSLGYYDWNGEFKETYPKVAYKQGDPPVNIKQPLGGIVGKPVEFVLIIRANGDPANAWALLVAPRVLRP
ncbi:MAG: hypothetical protein AB1750_17415 [Chloroflexota bacterium]